ncbi:MAG: hypothetical protein RIC80_10660 [Cyclobacteriaceae bacterium]
MTIQDAYSFFEGLIAKSTKKSETKVYKKFNRLLSGLKKREFSEEDIQSLETKLESLNLESIPSNREKYYHKALSTFEKYLRETYSLAPKGYYTKLYGGLGLPIGLLFGVVFLSIWERSLGISLGLLIGMVVGSTIGQVLDKQVVSEGRLL